LAFDEDEDRSGSLSLRIQALISTSDSLLHHATQLSDVVHSPHREDLRLVNQLDLRSLVFFQEVAEQQVEDIARNGAEKRISR